MEDLGLFFSWCNDHLKHIESVETDEGEETYFQNVTIGGYNFEDDTYWLSDEKKAKKLHEMWKIFLSK